MGDDNSNALALRISFLKHDLPYLNTNGDTVAPSFDHVLSNNFVGEATLLPFQVGAFSRVWTGLDESGLSTTNNCENQ
ncbi:MAG: hypothetical protein ACI89S_002079, partial [Gammaproteobacteria bacterium]